MKTIFTMIIADRYRNKYRLLVYRQPEGHLSYSLTSEGGMGFSTQCVFGKTFLPVFESELGIDETLAEWLTGCAESHGATIESISLPSSG